VEFQTKFLTFLNSYDITIEEYLYCYYIYHKLPIGELPVSDIEVVSKKVEERGLSNYLDILFKDELEWVELWQKLWPEGVKQNGVYLRSTLPALKKKFKSFLKKYDVSKETIIQATKYYLEEQKKDGYKYTSLAHNFIEKDGISNLGALCQNPEIANYSSNWVDRA